MLVISRWVWHSCVHGCGRIQHTYMPQMWSINVEYYLTLSFGTFYWLLRSSSGICLIFSSKDEKNLLFWKIEIIQSEQHSTHQYNLTALIFGLAKMQFNALCRCDWNCQSAALHHTKPSNLWAIKWTRVCEKECLSLSHTQSLIKSHHQNIKSPNYSHILPHSVSVCACWVRVCATQNRYDVIEYGDCGYDICQWFITTKRNHSFSFSHTHPISTTFSTLTIHCCWLSDPSVWWTEFLITFVCTRKMVTFFRTYIPPVYSHCIPFVFVSLSICSVYRSSPALCRIVRDRFSLLPVI